MSSSEVEKKKGKSGKHSKKGGVVTDAPTMTPTPTPSPTVSHHSHHEKTMTPTISVKDDDDNNNHNHNNNNNNNDETNAPTSGGKKRGKKSNKKLRGAESDEPVNPPPPELNETFHLVSEDASPEPSILTIVKDGEESSPEPSTLSMLKDGEDPTPGPSTLSMLKDGEESSPEPSIVSLVKDGEESSSLSMLKDGEEATPEPSVPLVSDNDPPIPPPVNGTIYFVGDNPQPDLPPLNMTAPERGNMMLAEQNGVVTSYGSWNKKINSFYWFSSIMLLGGTFVAYLYRKRYGYTPIPSSDVLQEFRTLNNMKRMY